MVCWLVNSVGSASLECESLVLERKKRPMREDAVLKLWKSEEAVRRPEEL